MWAPASPGLADPVQDTANDAVQSKASAAALGYFADPYVQALAKGVRRRSPLINRGTYTRVAVIRDLARQFLLRCRRDGAPSQIISFGGGFDTLYLTLMGEGLTADLFVEVDLPEICDRKRSLLATSPTLAGAVGRLDQVSGSSSVYATSSFVLVSADLRDLPVLETRLHLAVVDFDSRRTLFLSECVLVYMRPEHADALIRWASDRFCGPSMFVIYEQILPDDPFGRTMCQNLERRGCPLLSIHAHPTLQVQQERFLERGWSNASALDMNTIYERVLDRADVARIERIEMFDEFEEWNIILAHYCVVVATTSLSTFQGGIFDRFSTPAN